jgi:excisionase family DNA binding protein
MSDETISMTEAARILGVSTGTISAMVKRGDLRATRLISDRRRLLISRKDVEEIQMRDRQVIDHLTSDKDW